ncbi:MAG TPA: AMP-binding protein [Actinomycetes bacterium]|nr:AMP-binding protein [Actinomycetes bacterium]
MARMEHNLAALGEDSLERHGDFESLMFEGRWHRSGELFERTRRLAGGFRRLGVEPGDRVAVMLPNCPEVGISYGALWRAGAAITPVIFLLPPPELRYVLEHSGARAIITAPELLGGVLAAAEGLQALQWVISTGSGEAGNGKVVPLESLQDAEPSGIVTRDDHDLAGLLYTGGTTGRAKGVMLSHENLWRCGKAAQESSRVSGIRRHIVPLPLSHAFGLIVTIVGLHAVEPYSTVLQRWFDPTAFLELVQEHRVQSGPVVPSMLLMLLTQPLEDYDLSSLRYLSCGAAPLPLEAAREIERRLPGLEVREGYGCTESGAVISSTPAGGRKLGSVGRPLAGYEVRILDDLDREVPVGERGEICCRAPGVMLGYWNAPETTAETLRGGWLHTGDIGYLDEDGYLWVVDRKKDLIIRGGFNVFPRDVEDTLLEHPAVAMSGVVGRPDPVHGEEVVAFVALRPGSSADPDELIGFARSRLSAYKYPREVHVLDTLPLTPVGKVDRKALRSRGELRSPLESRPSARRGSPL